MLPPLASGLILTLLINSQIALEDPLWKLMQAHEDVPYRVSDMKQDIFDAWSRTPGNEPSCNPNQTGFLHADRLLRLYNILTEKPLISQSTLIELGHRVGVHDQAFRKAYEESQRKRKWRKNSKHHEELSASQSQMADNFAKKASATDTLREMQRELDATLAQPDRDEDDHEQKSNVDHGLAVQPQVKRLSNLAAASPLAATRIGSSASNKLNYIISEVIQCLCYPIDYKHLTFHLGSKIFSWRKDPHFLRISTIFSSHRRSTRTDPCQVPSIYNANCVSHP